MEIITINGFSFEVIHKEDDWKIVKDVSTFHLSGTNDNVFVQDGYIGVIDLNYINDYLCSIKKSKYKNGHLRNKIIQLEKQKYLIQSYIRESRIDAVVNEPFKPYLAC